MSEVGYDTIRDAGLGEFIGSKLLDVTSRFASGEEFLSQEEPDTVYFYFDNGRTVGVVLHPSTLLLDPSFDEEEDDEQGVSVER